MRIIHWLLLLALVAPGVAGQAHAPQLSQKEARAVKIFSERVQQYIKLQRDVEASLPALKPTDEVERIADYQHALARKIVQARRGAHQGDVFTREVTHQFRRIIRNEFMGTEARHTRRTIRPDEPFKAVIRLNVNDVYPDDIPLTTTPPNLLSKLPGLPQELAYRIVGRDLTLKDTKACLIVDLIPNAIPRANPLP